MSMPLLCYLCAAVAMVCASIVPGAVQNHPAKEARKVNTTFFKVNEDITLRRMVVHNPDPEGSLNEDGLASF